MNMNEKNKNNTGVIALVVALIVAVIGAGIWWFTKQNVGQLPEPQGQQVVQTGSIGTGAEEMPEPPKPQAETILMVVRDNDEIITDEIVKSMQGIGQQMNQTLVKVSPSDPRVANIVKGLWENIYYPLFVLSTESPNIKFDEIDKSFIVEDSAQKLFVLKEPALAGFPKMVIGQNAETKALIAKYAKPIQAKDSKVKILVVKDPLCPACSSSYNDKTIQDSLKDFSQEALYFPLPSHKNSEKLVGILNANQNHYELLGVMLDPENLTPLSNMSENELYPKVVELAKAKWIEGVNDGEKVSEEAIKELQKIALNLALQGTPSYFIMTENEYIPIMTFDVLEKYKN